MDTGRQRVSRRGLLASLAQTGAGAAFAACAPPGAGSGQGQQAKAPVALEAWSPWEGTPGDWERRLAAFQQVHPHISIRWTGTGFATYLEKVTTAVASGTPHDLSYLDNQHQGFFGRNKLLLDQGPLGKRDKDFRVEQIEPRAMELYTYEGTVLGYPWMLTTGQVFFNRAIFQAAGRPTPEQLFREGRWTWDAMAQAAVALTRRGPDGKVDVLGLSHMSIWRLALNSNGTDLFDDFRRPNITVPLGVLSDADGGSLGPASGGDDASGTRPRRPRRSVVGAWRPTGGGPASGGSRGR